MSKNAAAYAQKLADMDTLVQSSYTERPEQGENIALGCYEDREETAEEAIKGWYVHVFRYFFAKFYFRNMYTFNDKGNLVIRVPTY